MQKGHVNLYPLSPNVLQTTVYWHWYNPTILYRFLQFYWTHLSVSKQFYHVYSFTYPEYSHQYRIPHVALTIPTSLLPTPNTNPGIHLSVLQFLKLLLFQKYYINGVIQYITFGIGSLPQLPMQHNSLEIHASVAWIDSSFLFLTEWYSMV